MVDFQSQSPDFDIVVQDITGGIVYIGSSLYYLLQLPVNLQLCQNNFFKEM